MPRLEDLQEFYKLMDRLEERTDGRRQLGCCDPTADPTDAGVYFFFEKEEKRKGSGNGGRITYVGKCTSYRRRISRMHRGPPELLTGSSFRKWIANALFGKRRDTVFANWPDITEMNFARRQNPMRESLNHEQQHKLEYMIRQYMFPMELLFLPIGQESCRRYIERHAIGLLSEYEVEPIDPPSCHWLGKHSRSGKIRLSGLWNVKHVADDYDPELLQVLQGYVDDAG